MRVIYSRKTTLFSIFVTMAMNMSSVINSYTYPFDIFDKYLFELLHKIVSKNIENIEYMVVLTHTDN